MRKLFALRASCVVIALSAVQQPVQATELPKCVQVINSYITTSIINPQYVVTVKDACETDLGSVSVQFFSGSTDIRFATPQIRSIFKLSKWGETLYFDLGNISKGTYVPRLSVTIGKEPWNPNNIILNGFTVTGSSPSKSLPIPKTSSPSVPTPIKTPSKPTSSSSAVISARIYPADKNWAAWIESFEYVSGPNPLSGSKSTKIKITGSCTSAGKTIQVMKNRSDDGSKYPNGMRYIKPVLVCTSGKFSGTVKVTGDTRISITELPQSHTGTEILFRIKQEVVTTKID